MTTRTSQHAIKATIVAFLGVLDLLIHGGPALRAFEPRSRIRLPILVDSDEIVGPLLEQNGPDGIHVCTMGAAPSSSTWLLGMARHRPGATFALMWNNAEHMRTIR